jgi:hypothetical protein
VCETFGVRLTKQRKRLIFICEKQSKEGGYSSDGLTQLLSQPSISKYFSNLMSLSCLALHWYMV